MRLDASKIAFCHSGVRLPLFVLLEMVVEKLERDVKLIKAYGDCSANVQTQRLVQDWLVSCGSAFRPFCSPYAAHITRLRISRSIGFRGPFSLTEDTRSWCNPRSVNMRNAIPLMIHGEECSPRANRAVVSIMSACTVGMVER